MRKIIFILLSCLSALCYGQDFDRELHFGMGAVGIDGIDGTTTGYEYRFGATATYPDITFDLEVTNVRFNGLDGKNFYHSGTMYLGRNLLPGLFIGVGPTFISTKDDGLFGMSAKLNIDFWTNKKYRIFTQAGLHYSGQFVIWSGTLNVAYRL